MSDWIETFRGAVLASEYDASAHMNTQIYGTRFDQATWFVLATIGVTPTAMRRQGKRVAIVRQTIQYLRELKGGELIVVKSGFVAVGEKRIRFLHRMFDSETGRLVAVSDCTAVQASLKSQKTLKLTKAQRTAAESHLVTDNVADTGGL